MDNKFWLLSQKEEIADLMRKAPLVEIGDIWQKQIEKRDIFKIKALEVLSDAIIFISETPFEMDLSAPIFIKINYKNIIFKLDPGEYKVSSNQLSCSYPKAAKASEFRKLERTRLPKKSGLDVTLKITKDGEVKELKVSLEDVSLAGIGIRAVSMNTDLFQAESLIQLIKICGQPLDQEMNLVVKHIYGKPHKGYIGIGLASQRPLTMKFFEILEEEIKRDKFIIA